MKIKIDPTVIFRTPRFSYHSDLFSCWEELKKSIAISSNSFYQIVKDVKADDLKTVPPRVFFTIWKYFNRAQFRSTPYGTFASFSVLENAFKFDSSNIIIAEKQQVIEFTDWPVKNNIQFLFSDLLKNNALIFSNSSYYHISGNIRYIACTEGLFELAEIKSEDLINKILIACSQPIKFTDLIEKLALSIEEEESLATLLEDMHGIQLVFTDFDANIVGEDYFQRLKIGVQPNLSKYIIAKREVKSGEINQNLFLAIPNLISLLQGIVPINELEALKKFKDKFKRKFEHQEVSLVIALDPELGIGYDELEQAGHEDDFITKLSSKTKSKTLDSNLKTILSNALSVQKFEQNETIFLDKLSFINNSKTVQTPNTFSMLLSVADDLIIVDQIGGSTANALNGRFTLADVAVENNCKSVAAMEQSANPDVLFFDVAYMVETDIDNINRRKLVYNHQLSILNFDTSNDPLTLNDIAISIMGDEVVLRSKKHNKRVIPKIASAYNYSRSDLAVFRLLCDIQNQGIQTNLSLKLDQIFPNLDYYPRLQYQNIVLSRSKWQVSKTEILSGAHLSVEYCRSHLQDKGISRYFKTGSSDQTLCFDMTSDDDLTAFIQFMQKQTTLYLEEVILPDNSAVMDEDSNPYLAQFVLNLNHDHQIYFGLDADADQPEEPITKNFLPGTEWLYFEIYCHQQRTDQILRELIAPFIADYSAKIKSWFFIRYNENGNHLRFRILLYKELDSQMLTSAFSSCLSEQFNEGLISDVQIKTYKRELDRYGADLMILVEDHFFQDSNFVLAMLETQPEDFDKYRICSDLIFNIQNSAIIDKAEFTKLIKFMSDSFNNEHHLEATDFKQLNIQYQLYRKSELVLLNESQLKMFTMMNKSFINILKECAPNKRLKLLSDLIHMHVNRFFNKDQRTNEMIMYYFLLKDLQRKNALCN